MARVSVPPHLLASYLAISSFSKNVLRPRLGNLLYGLSEKGAAERGGENGVILRHLKKEVGACRYTGRGAWVEDGRRGGFGWLLCQAWC